MTGSESGEPRQAKPSLATGLLALVIGLLLAALLTELVVLIVFGEQPKFPRHVVGAPWGLRYNEPDSHYRHKSGDGTFWFRINGQGMRSERDFAYEKPEGTARIVSLGDSFTVGYEVAAEECFSSVLERELLRRGYGVEVLNAGVSGFSNAEELLYLERELIKYDPDLVVLSFFTNDLVDNVRSGLLVLEDGRLEPRSQSYVPAGRLGDLLNSSPLFNFLSGYSNAFALIKERATTIVKRRMIAQNEANESRAAGRREETPQELDARPGPDRGDAQGRLAAAILERLYDFARERSIPVVIQSIPSGGYAVPVGDRPLLDLFPYEHFDGNRPGLAVLPMIDLLKPHVGETPLTNLRSHFHWTAFAHGLSGRALAKRIVENGFLD